MQSYNVQMNLQLHHIIWLSLIAAGACYWWYTRELKEIAYRAVKRYCDSIDIQLLDFAVYESQSGITTHRGKITTKRTFQFEFATTGELRYRGRILLIGRKVSNINVEPHRFDI